jgi:mRNA interferase RelE/StbE
MFRVEVSPEALEQFLLLPRSIKGRVEKILRRLETWPAVSGVKPLSGNLAGWYRLRTGDYRVRFHLAGQVLIVDKIGHRRDFYED